MRYALLGAALLAMCCLVQSTMIFLDLTDLIANGTINATINETNMAETILVGAFYVPYEDMQNINYGNGEVLRQNSTYILNISAMQTRIRTEEQQRVASEIAGLTVQLNASETARDVAERNSFPNLVATLQTLGYAALFALGGLFCLALWFLSKRQGDKQFIDMRGAGEEATKTMSGLAGALRSLGGKGEKK